MPHTTEFDEPIDRFGYPISIVNGVYVKPDPASASYGYGLPWDKLSFPDDWEFKEDLSPDSIKSANKPPQWNGQLIFIAENADGYPTGIWIRTANQ
jgi:hypothetical protein